MFARMPEPTDADYNGSSTRYRLSRPHLLNVAAAAAAAAAAAGAEIARSERAPGELGFLDD